MTPRDRLIAAMLPRGSVEGRPPVGVDTVDPRRTRSSQIPNYRPGTVRGGMRTRYVRQKLWRT